jgi:amino acid adenylation domain-containing protein
MTATIIDLVAPGFCDAERIAIEDGERCVRYGELAAIVDRVAGGLRAAGVTQSSRVCLLLPKSAEAIAAILGVLKIGAIYVPLDGASPPARLGLMVAGCAPGWLLTTRSLRSLASACIDEAGDRIVGLLELDDRHEVHPIHDGPVPEEVGADPLSGEALAYILFTSGSTGTPKGVPIPHRNVVEYAGWANSHFGVRPGERIVSQAPLHFDMSVWDIFGTLAAGATLVLVPSEASLTPLLTVQFMRESRIQQWYSVPSILTAMAARDVLEPIDLPDMKRVIWGGDSFPVPALRYWMQRVPHAQFVNVYGPTEATINCTYFMVPRDWLTDRDQVPIGMPIPGRRLMIRDEEDRRLGTDRAGALYVGGSGLSPGYWNDPEKTHAAFRSFSDDPGGRWYKTGDLAHVDEAGIFHFHGRADRQIKSRGYRIELDEVAVALARIEGIEQCAVIATPIGGFEGWQICAAYVSIEDVPMLVADLKSKLGSILPRYMIPRRWAQLTALPTNANGKVDLPKVRDIFADA